MSEGKKNRKIGKAKRKPSNVRYTAERRAERNKAKRMARQDKFEAACALIRVRHGGKYMPDTQRRIRQGT